MVDWGDLFDPRWRNHGPKKGEKSAEERLNDPERVERMQGYLEKRRTEREARQRWIENNGPNALIDNILGTLKSFQTPPKLTLEDVLAGLPGVNVGGIPTPDRNAYLQPFDQAEAATRQVHGQVVPTIDNIFSTLQTGMGQQEQEFTNRINALAAAAGQQQQAAAAATPVQSQIAVDPNQVVGSLAAELAAGNAANTSAQATRNQADLAMLNEIAAMGQADSASVQQSAQAVGAGARANADAQLQAALNAIGMGRAQAESQYNQEAARIAAENAGLQMDAARLQMDQRNQAMQEWGAVNQDIAKQATGSAFASRVRQLEKSDPEMYRSLVGPDGIIDVAGTDRNEVNYATAIGMIDAEVEAGGVSADEASTLQEYVRNYYLGGDEIDMETYRKLGGDPAFLRTLEK